MVQRVGQDLFRAGLLDYWEGRCAVTGLGVRELLRASHIKPWAEWRTDAERLDVFNGFLLEARIDAVFDQGFVTVADDGRMLVAAELGAEARELLGLDQERRVLWLDEQHRTYLAWHRARVFRGG
nr:HNH endonuclease [Deltaproteobacteria bacterium]